MKPKFAIRQIAALLCVGTLAWDFSRDAALFDNFSLWALALHFVYFQLPLNSRALAYLHPTSFIGATLIPVMYGHLLFWSPMLEINHMEVWDISWSTVVIRACLVNFAPLLFHTLDITSNQANLINLYKTKPQNFMYVWSLISFACFGFIFELSYPETEETNDLFGITRDEFIRRNKLLSLCCLVFSYYILYLLIIRRAYHIPKRHSFSH